MLAIIWGAWSWQGRHLLESDGSVTISGLTLPSLKGELVSMEKNGKPTVIYFFAPWCKVCALSIGNLQYLNADKVNVITVALDYSTVEEVQQFVSDHDVSAEVLLGTNRQKHQFNIKAYPTYYVLDKDHKVVSSSMGYSSALGLKFRKLWSDS